MPPRLWGQSTRDDPPNPRNSSEPSLSGGSSYRSPADLLSIEHGVEPALAPLLDDPERLTIDGGEAATLADVAGYRVCDLAGYLLASKRGENWPDEVDPAVRDARIEHLRS
jgi:hypothetical protein